MKKFLVIALLALTTVSCAVMPSHEKMKADIEGYKLANKPDKNSALIYVVRPSVVGTAIKFNVFLDSKDEKSEIGYNRGVNYIFFTVEPKKHTIFSKAENWDEIEINPKAGETIFIKQTPSMGFVMARNKLEKVDEVEGKYSVKNSALGKIYPKK